MKKESQVMLAYDSIQSMIDDKKSPTWLMLGRFSLKCPPEEKLLKIKKFGIIFSVVLGPPSNYIDSIYLGTKNGDIIIVQTKLRESGMFLLDGIDYSLSFEKDSVIPLEIYGRVYRWPSSETKIYELNIKDLELKTGKNAAIKITRPMRDPKQPNTKRSPWLFTIKQASK